MSIFYRKNLKNYFKQYSKSKIKLPNNSILCLISSASRLNLCSEQNDNSDNNLFLSVFHLFKCLYVLFFDNKINLVPNIYLFLNLFKDYTFIIRVFPSDPIIN